MPGEAEAILPSASSNKVYLLCENVFELPRQHNIVQLTFRGFREYAPPGKF